MDAYFFRFQKRRESTLAPSTSDALFSLSNVIINDANSSVMNPNIRVTYQQLASSPYTPIFLCNYCYLPRFERYYYIGDWSCNADGTWTAACSVDVLASFRSNIQLSGGYVDRATSINNQNIMDAFYPAANLQFLRKSTLTTGMVGNPSLCTYLIGVLSGSGTAAGEGPTFGTTTYYYITQANLKQLIIDMMNTGSEDWSQVTDLGGDVVKSIVDPLQFIVSCKMFPFSPPSNRTYTDSISFGYWSSNALGCRCSDIEEHMSRSWSLVTTTPSSGQVQMYPTAYTYSGATYNLPMYPPYASFTLIHPAFGTFEIDPAILATYPSISMETRTNYISGMSTLIVSVYAGSTVSPDTYYELFRTSTMLAIDIPLAQITTDYVSLVKSAVGAVGNGAGIFTGGGTAAAVGLVNNIIDAATTAIHPNVQSSGPPAGSFVSNITNAYLEEARFATIPQDPASFGYAAKQHISSLPTSGFVKMAHTDFAGPCTSQEREMICEFLEGGVFMEGFGNG